jgi:hypothetical protein
MKYKLNYIDSLRNNADLFIYISDGIYMGPLNVKISNKISKGHLENGRRATSGPPTTGYVPLFEQSL